jgi:ROS/MUCR transcriptional regulator protein
MATPEQKRAARRKIRPGFPKTFIFTDPKELHEYLNNETITCLRCGKEFKSLGIHLQNVHNMNPDEYRSIYGIPWTKGLTCASTTKIRSEITKEKFKTGEFKASKEQAALARKSLKKQRPRQPIREVLCANNLAILNADSAGKEAERRRNASPRGTPNFKAKMAGRPQCKSFGVRMAKARSK